MRKKFTEVHPANRPTQCTGASRACPSVAQMTRRQLLPTLGFNWAKLQAAVHVSQMLQTHSWMEATVFSLPEKLCERTVKKRKTGGWVFWLDRASLSLLASLRMSTPWPFLHCPFFCPQSLFFYLCPPPQQPPLLCIPNAWADLDLLPT